MARTPIKTSDLLVERPLEWNIYDADGTLLYAKGAIIDAESKSQLLRRGALREVDAEIGKLVTAQGDKTTCRPTGVQSKDVRIPLTDTALRPGDVVHLDRPLDGSRIVARLIGYLKGKSIVITVPADEQGAIFLKEGESIRAKAFSGKHLLTFSCTVLAVATKPFSHIHLSYPADVTGIVVRRAERAAVRIIAAIDLDREQVSGIITDLSTGGLSFASRSKSIGVGAEAVFNFKLMLSDCIYLMKLRGTIRTIRAQRSEVLDGAETFGVQFGDLSAEDTLLLSLFVNQQVVSARDAGV